MDNLSLKAAIFEIVKKIPQGKLAYFGQIASILNSNPRTVGWILSGMSESECEQIPWYRVVAKNGFISSLKLGYKGQLQKEILISQGYKVIDDHLDMNTYLISTSDLENHI